MLPRVAVLGTCETTRQLASELTLPLLNLTSIEVQNLQYGLIPTTRGLTLVYEPRRTGGAKVRVDFERTRKRGASFGGSPFLRAILNGQPKNTMPWVVDATAGLGADAFVMADVGMQVTLIEQHPVLFALLRDGLERARNAACVSTAAAAARMRLFQGDSTKILGCVAQGADVVYIDPMYPTTATKRSALPQKGMAAARSLLNESEQEGGLFLSQILAAAGQASIARGVLKRPKRAAPQLAPLHCFASKDTRFDLYAIQGVK